MRKVLIVEAEEEYRRPLLAALEGQYEVYYAEDATEASLFLSSMAFDAMVLDLCLSGLDGLSLLRLHIQHLPPCVLVITGFSSGYVRRYLSDMGVGYLLMKPCSVPVIVGHLKNMLRQTASLDVPNTPDAISGHIMQVLGLSPKRDGFRALLTGIPLYAHDPQQSLSKELYPSIARFLGIGNYKSVERSIRSAIQYAWVGRNPILWNSYFGTGSECPTNKLFIARLAQVISEQARWMRPGG